MRSTQPERAASWRELAWVREAAAGAAACGRAIDPLTGWHALCDWPTGWEIPNALLTSALAEHRGELFDPQNGALPAAQKRRLRRLLDKLDREDFHAPSAIVGAIRGQRPSPALRLADVLDALSRKLDQAIEDRSRGFHIYW